MGSTPDLRQSIAVARAHLDDLQAELEAGSRHTEAIDRMVTQYVEEAARMDALVRRIRELKAATAQQRTILAQLRGSIDAIRRQAASGRRSCD